MQGVEILTPPIESNRLGTPRVIGQRILKMGCRQFSDTEERIMISSVKTHYDERGSMINNSLRRQTLRFSQIEGAMWSLMVGSFETFVMYYVVKRGVSNHELAVLTTVPVLLGAIANWIVPLLTPTRFLKLGIVVTCIVQILGIVGIIVSIESIDPHWICLSALSLYWIGAMACSPLWIDWISGWLPHDKLGRFLGRRNGFNAFLIVVTYLSIALLLFHFDRAELFIYPFTLAAVSRLISTIMLGIQTTPPYPRIPKSKVEHRESPWMSKPILYVILFTTLFRFVTNVATPFLVPYMMKGLEFNLIQYACLAAMPFIGRAIMFSRWGETLRSHSPLIVLQICMFLVSATCLGWSQLTSLFGLGVIECISGMAWGGFELAGVILMQSFRPGNARALIGLHLALSHLAAIGGALLGAHLLESNLNYIDIIQTSATLRFGVLGLFILVSFKIHPPRLHLKQIQNCLVTVFRQFVPES